jgi:hypothetical protein
MSIGDYSGLLEPEVVPHVMVLLVQVGITLLYVKDVGREKLDIIFGEVGVIRVWKRWAKMGWRRI